MELRNVQLHKLMVAQHAHQVITVSKAQLPFSWHLVLLVHTVKMVSMLNVQKVLLETLFTEFHLTIVQHVPLVPLVEKVQLLQQLVVWLITALLVFHHQVFLALLVLSEAT